jgi:hypothetical protein
VHDPRAVYSWFAAVEVVGTVVAGARRNVPVLGVVQTFPVPLLPPEAALTVVIPVRGVKVA